MPPVPLVVTVPVAGVEIVAGGVKKVPRPPVGGGATIGQGTPGGEQKAPGGGQVIAGAGHSTTPVVGAVPVNMVGGAAVGTPDDDVTTSVIGTAVTLKPLKSSAETATGTLECTLSKAEVRTSPVCKT